MALTAKEWMDILDGCVREHYSIDGKRGTYTHYYDGGIFSKHMRGTSQKTHAKKLAQEEAYVEECWARGFEPCLPREI